MAEESGGFMSWVDSAWGTVTDTASEYWDAMVDTELEKQKAKLKDKSGTRPETVHDSTQVADPVNQEMDLIQQYKTPLMVFGGVLLLAGVAYAVSR